MKKLILIATALLSLIGCTTYSMRMSEITMGMTKEEVTKTIGKKPDGYNIEGEYETLYFYNRPLHWNLNQGMGDLFVILKNGKVTEYGTKNIRLPQKGGGVHVITTIPAY